MRNQFFTIEEKHSQLLSLAHPDDPHAMNWVEGDCAWGTVVGPKELDCVVSRSFAQDRLRERYVFTNTSPYDLFTKEGEVGIYATFNDDYLSGEYLTNRCHAHIWCGGEIAYVCALRMDGTPPHLGLYLTEGNLIQYSVVRNLEHRSNDRGDFILHPRSFQLAPGESATIEWELFWYEGIDDFYDRIQRHPGHIHVAASQYILFAGETAEISVAGKMPVFINGSVPQSLPFAVTAGEPGAMKLDIATSNKRTQLELLALPEQNALIKARCRFIAKKQQYHKEGSVLDGAYLAYDNENGQPVYSHKDHDINGGRERVCMGALVTRYLQRVDDGQLRASLDKYLAYVLRELFDESTGVVFNDVRRNNDWDRFYNIPWMSTFFLEVYKLCGDTRYLRDAFLALESYYQKGGAKLCGIDIQMEEIVSCLEKAEMHREAENLMKHFRRHCDFLLSTGTDYNTSEVNYEQSIVAPSTNTLFQFYFLTGEDAYLQGAREQLHVLEQFNGLQPDYHLNEVSIRHWDGYWFGKRKLYGDTFPHYWSSLTGNAFLHMYRASGDVRWREKGERSLRGSLSMFFPDGSATCAVLYPLTANGQRGMYADPWSNDQDWALYFWMRYQDAKH